MLERQREREGGRHNSCANPCIVPLSLLISVSLHPVLHSSIRIVRSQYVARHSASSSRLIADVSMTNCEGFSLSKAVTSTPFPPLMGSRSRHTNYAAGRRSSRRSFSLVAWPINHLFLPVSRSKRNERTNELRVFPHCSSSISPHARMCVCATYCVPLLAEAFPATADTENLCLHTRTYTHTHTHIRRQANSFCTHTHE